MDEDDPAEIQAAHQALIARGVIEPLSRDERQTRRWLDCELASLVENRFFTSLDPRRIDDEERARWEPRATSDEPLSSPHGHRFYRRVYWMLDEGERAGTFGLGTMYLGIGLLTVSSLYTLPSRRRRGAASRVLGEAERAVIASGGRGLRVTTHWTWQPAVRFYLGLGMWALGWKHSLVFTPRQDLPRFIVDVREREARFSVEREGSIHPLIIATRDGERLGWTELPGMSGELRLRARETFAVALATHGFPLIRSPAAWDDRHRSCDGGDPEGLAHKIALWEAWEKQQGHEVRTPRIPGLAYPAWDEAR